jgi:hypothetical protein
MLCFVFRRVDASTQRQASNMTSFVLQYCCMMTSTLQEWQEEFQKPSYSLMVYMALRYCLQSLWFRVIEFCFIIVAWIEPTDWAALSPMWYSQCDIFKGFMINLPSKLCYYFCVLVSWPDVWCAMEHMQFMYREVWVRVVETAPILLLSSSWSHWDLVFFPTFCAWQETVVWELWSLSSSYHLSQWHEPNKLCKTVCG